MVVSVAVLVAAGIGGWKFGQVAPPEVAAPQQTTTSSAPTSTTTASVASTTTTTAAPSTSTSTTLLGKIDFTSDLVSAFGDNLQRLQTSGGLTNLDSDKTKLAALTGIGWSTDMLVALGASYCNDWPTEPDTDGTLSDEGQRQWAAAMAPVLSAPAEATLTAVQSGIPLNYQYVCD